MRTPDEINSEEEYFQTVPEFSKDVGCHDRTTCRYIASEELEAVYVGGKYLISRAAKKRFLRNRRGARPANTGGASSDAS